jgi:hypothetical protein
MHFYSSLFCLFLASVTQPFETAICEVSVCSEFADSGRAVSKPSLTGIMEGLLVVRKLHTSTLSENVSNKFVGVSANGPTVHYVRYDTL